MMSLNAQVGQCKVVAPAAGVMHVSQTPRISNPTFGPKLGCQTRRFNTRRSAAIKAQRSATVVQTVAAAKGYKASGRLRMMGCMCYMYIVFVCFRMKMNWVKAGMQSRIAVA